MKSEENLQIDLKGLEEEGVSREMVLKKGPSLFTPKKIPHFKDENNIFLWSSLRLMLALWTIEESPFFLLSNAQLNKLDIVSIAVFVISMFVLFVSFFSAIESMMRWLLMIWSTTSLAYHLLNFLLSSDPSVGVSKDLLVAALLPLWGSLYSLPLALLWTQQLAAFLTVVSCTLLQEHPPRFTDWEFVGTHGLLTLLGMVMTYTHQASSHSAERDSKMSSRMYEQTSEFFKKQVHQKEQQVQSERDMALFISHEVRNPLFNISNGLEFFDQCLTKLGKVGNVKELPPLISSMQSCTADVKIGVQHCTHLLTNILNLSKIEQGKVEWQDKMVNLSKLCNNVIALTKYMANESVSLSADVPPDVWVLCDEQLLSQVLVNLVANALKFTPCGFVLLRVRQVTKGMLSKRGHCLSSTAVVPENKPFETAPGDLQEFSALSDISPNKYSQIHPSVGSLDFDKIHPIEESCRLDSSSNSGSKMSGLHQSLNLLSTSPNDSIRSQQKRCYTNPEACHPGTPASMRRCNTTPDQSHSSTPNQSHSNTGTFRSFQSVASSNISGSLVRMARHFSKHRGSSSEPSLFQFEVCDTGPGIKEEKQGKLFQRFQQAGNHFGAGLGLMLSQKIIQFKGGNIELVSPTWTDEERGIVNVGSVFKFALKMKAVTPSPEESLGAGRERDCVRAIDQLMVSSPTVIEDQNNGWANLVGLKVLLIDDSRLNLKQLKHKLTQQSPFTELRWLCEMALTGKKALEFLARSEPFLLTRSNSSPNLLRAKRPRICCSGMANSDFFSIAIVDSELNLDDDALSNGHEVICRIRKMEQVAKLKGSAIQSMLIISYSGHIDQEHQRKAIAAGADIVWSKPLPSPRKMLQDILQSSWWASLSPPDSRMDYLDLSVE